MPQVIGETTEGVFIIHLFDEIVISRLSGIREKIDKFNLESHARVLIDLENVTFLDSSGLGYLVILLQRIMGNDSSVALCNPSELVLRLLKMVSIDEYVRIVELDLDSPEEVSSALSPDPDAPPLKDIDELDSLPVKE